MILKLKRYLFLISDFFKFFSIKKNFIFRILKEMAKSMPQMDVPDVSDMLASWLGGNPKKTSKKILSNKKRIIEDF